MFLYSVYDIKAETYAPPFIARNDKVAFRMILDVCRDPQISLVQYPADYQVRVLGEWFEDTGINYKVGVNFTPVCIATVEELLKDGKAILSQYLSDEEEKAQKAQEAQDIPNA